MLALHIAALRRAYREGASPVEVIEAVASKIAADGTEGIWTHVRSTDEMVAEARSIERSRSSGPLPPLFGLPFGVKDNIDVGGVPTTVACPALAYVPAESAPVVERIRAAGGIFVGKTNMDQLATGLVGTRSPYGIPPNPFDPRYVTGGSSSGSAAAVARGLVSFALSTDTAGSGRVPPAFNHIVGLKPSRGLLSTRGVVPACRSLDCVSITALTCDDVREVVQVAAGYDARDPSSRPEASRFRWQARVPTGSGLRVAIPRSQDLSFDDDSLRERFDHAIDVLGAMGATVEPIDMALFFEAGQLLYGGPWIAERYAEFESVVEARPSPLLPITQTILSQAKATRGTDVYRGLHRLLELERAVAPLWSGVDALVVPSVPSFPRIDQVLADPIAANSRLGLYSTFANLLDLAGVAVPSGLRSDGLPSGVTFLGPWGRDAGLLALASAFHRKVGGPLGATGWPWPEPGEQPSDPPAERLSIAVVGAHLSGMALNPQLTERGASFVCAARTAPSYRLYALPDMQPPKPGLVRVAEGEGMRIEVEVWALPVESVGSFLAGVGSPLAIGSIELDNGERVHGFLCESHAVATARDISSFGGWRRYVAELAG
jgi:allophanate hydrolase